MKFDKNSTSVNLARHKAQLVVHYSEREQFSKILTTKDSNYNKVIVSPFLCYIKSYIQEEICVCVTVQNSFCPYRDIYTCIHLVHIM